MVDPTFVVPLAKPCVYFDTDFLPKDAATDYYQDLLQNIHWEKTSKINRWVSLHHCRELTDHSYQYKDAPGAARLGFPETVEKIRQAAQEWYFEQTHQHVEFNVCLLNYYESGQQRIGWHSDREEIGRTTPIASVSLGATRQFLLRNKTTGPQDRASFDLPNGSMVVMENICQHEYLHSIPKQPEIEDGRINLTFRCKEFTTDGELEHEKRDDWLSNITEGTRPNAEGWSNSGVTPNHNPSLNIFGDDVTVETLDPEYPTIYFLLKTNLGTERYCAAEVQELLDESNMNEAWRVISRPQRMDGFVACCCPSDGVSPDIKDETIKVLLDTKSAQHLVEFHGAFHMDACCTEDMPTPDLVSAERLYSYFKSQVESGEIVIASLEQLTSNGGGTFRATCERIGGPHAFQSTLIEVEMGGALCEHYYPQIRAKMEDYDVCVRMDIVGYRVIVGTQINISDLSKDRHFLKFRNAVTIKTNIAYALVRLGNIQPGHTVLDPFCGSGTLLLEALEVYKRKVFCIGLDVSKKSAIGSRENAVAEGCGPDVCRFECSDARGLRRHVQEKSVDAIITNLPWGVQTGQRNSVTDLGTMYEIFLRTAWYVLKPGARIVMMVLRGLQTARIVGKLSGRYKLLSVNVVRTTNNLPSIVVVEKVEKDEIRESIKGQLAYLNQYVAVGPEIFQALHMEQIDDDGD